MGRSTISTIKDVAQAAGVSTATVSHVLNGTRHVQDETKRRVLAAVEDVQYRPNRTARSLRTRSTGMLGAIIYSNLSPYFTELLHWINMESVRCGYSTIVHYPANEQDEITAVERFLHQGVDGLLLNLRYSDKAARRLISGLNLPFVLINRVLGDPGSYSVCNDDSLGTELAMDHLLALGHRRIAFVGFPVEESDPYSFRFTAYAESLENAGIPADEQLVFWGDESGTPGYDAVQQFCSLPELPTAIFCCSDLLAMEIYRALYDRGLSVPEDISIVGFDDIDFAKYMQPPLTTVRQDMPSIAGSILKSVRLQIDGETPPVADERIPPVLMVRGSTAAPRSGSEGGGGSHGHD